MRMGCPTRRAHVCKPVQCLCPSRGVKTSLKGNHGANDVCLQLHSFQIGRTQTDRNLPFRPGQPCATVLKARLVKMVRNLMPGFMGKNEGKLVLAPDLVQKRAINNNDRAAITAALQKRVRLLAKTGHHFHVKGAMLFCGIRIFRPAHRFGHRFHPGRSTQQLGISR